MTLFDGGAPDVLVLGVGGLLGEAWMTGVLAGVEQATGHDMTACRAYVGSSAGSIVAASLAAGRSPRRPGRIPDGRREDAAAPARARAGRGRGSAAGGGPGAGGAGGRRRGPRGAGGRPARGPRGCAASYSRACRTAASPSTGCGPT